MIYYVPRGKLRDANSARTLRKRPKQARLPWLPRTVEDKRKIVVTLVEAKAHHFFRKMTIMIRVVDKVVLALHNPKISHLA